MRHSQTRRPGHNADMILHVPLLSPVVLIQVVNPILQDIHSISNEPQVLVTRTAKQTTNTLTAGDLTLAAAMIVVYLTALAVPAHPAQALKSIVKS